MSKLTELKNARLADCVNSAEAEVALVVLDVVAAVMH